MSKEPFETVFDYNITDKEVRELFSSSGCKTVEEFKKFTSLRNKEFGADFCSYVALSVLFSKRGEKDLAQKYTEKANQTEFIKCRNSHSHRS